MGIVTRAFPQKTIEGRLSDHFKLVSGKENNYPQTVKIYESGLICVWDGYLTLNNKENGELLEVWPKGSLSGDSSPFSITPILTDNGPIIYDHIFNKLIWLYPVNLLERVSLDFSSVEKINRAHLQVQSFTADNNGQVLLRLANENLSNAHIALISANAEIKNISQTEDAALKDTALIKSGLLCLSENGISFVYGETVFTETQNDSKDKLWPSPDGKFVITTGKDAARVTLYKISPDDEEPLKELLEGMYLQKTENRQEGWKFWDMKFAPDDQDPTALSNPFICWSKDSRLAAVGDQQGIAAIIDPVSIKAGKLMVQGDQSFWPLELVPPDKIVFINRTEIGTLKLNWEFGEEPEGGDHDIKTEKAEEEPSAFSADNTVKNKKPASYLLYVIPALILLAAIAGYFYFR